MSTVGLRSVSKAYGTTTALSDVNVEIAHGEFLTLLGPSGSGKTTLLNIVSGMIAPSSGSIYIGGRDVTNLPPGARDLGMVFQNYALMPHMSVFENVAFPLRIRGLGRKEISERVMSVLDVVQLSHLARRKPKELSGGQQQRVSIARCLVYQPALILMDEPLGALDKKLRDQLQLEIKKIHSELQVTILYVTHDQNEALVLSDRICVMNDSRIEQIGSPADLYFKPKTEFVADFLGESNVIEGTITSVNGKHVAVTSEGDLQFSAKYTTDAVANTVAKFLVRPESIQVSTKAASNINNVKGTIVSRIFSGESSQYHIKCTEGMTLVAKRYNQAAAEILEEGESIFASWDPADCCVIQQSSS